MTETSELKNNNIINDSYLWNLLQHSTSLLSRAREIELAQSGITMEQMSILQALLDCNGAATIDEIAAIIVRQHNSVSSIVNRMSKASLVKKEKRPRKKKYMIRILKSLFPHSDKPPVKNPKRLARHISNMILKKTAISAHQVIS